MSRPKTWLSEAHSIYKTVQQTEEDRRFDWQDLAALFGLGRRAAYKILSRLNPQKIESGASTVSRADLLDWLEPLAIGDNECRAAISGDFSARTGSRAVRRSADVLRTHARMTFRAGTYSYEI